MWFKEYGWKRNPFSIKINTNLFGLEDKKRDLMNYIQSGDICWLTGPTGVGKSSVLKWVEKNLKNHKIFYIDATAISSLFSITNFLMNKTPFFKRLTGKKFPSDTVLLVDESQECNKELIKALKLHWDHKNIKSIVITQIEDLDNFNESFRDRIGKRIIRLEKIPNSYAHELINFRTEGKNPFDKTSIQYITEKAGNRPRKILELCEIVCSKMAGKKKFINIFDTESILEGQVKLEPPKLELKSKRSRK